MNQATHGLSAGAVAAREKVLAVLELLETRMQYSAARALVSEAGLHASRGWRETLSRARTDSHNDPVWTRAYDVLSRAALNHSYVGNKHVHIFDLREQNVDSKHRVVDWATNRAVKDLQAILKKRPFSILDAPTKKETLEPYKDAPPQLVEASLVKDKLYLQFFTTRAYSTREELDISKMSAAQAKVFEDYEELIGVKTRQVPCFDTVVIDTGKDLVEFRTDFQLGMTEDKRVPPYVGVMNLLNEMSTKFIGQFAVGAGLMNFYPAIDKMYLDQKCGRVTALGFVARCLESLST